MTVETANAVGVYYSGRGPLWGVVCAVCEPEGQVPTGLMNLEWYVRGLRTLLSLAVCMNMQQVCWIRLCPPCELGINFKNTDGR